MKLTSQQIVEVVIAVGAYALNTFITARQRAIARYVTVLSGVALLFVGLH